MRYLLSLIFICNFSYVNSQTIDEVFSLYSCKQYREALQSAQKVMNDTPSAALSDVIGRIYIAMGKYDSAILYSRDAIKMDGDKTWVSGWSHAYLGKALFLKGEKEKAIAELNASIKLNMTKNSVDFAQHVLDYIGEETNRNNIPHYISSEPNWVVVERQYITYYFQDTAGWTEGMNNYIAEHEAGYKKINEVFRAQLPRKTIFYVWTDGVLAEKILGRPLGFTSPTKCISNVSRDQTIGHEMTHTLSYWGWGERPAKTTKFINEGVAVAFDLHKGNRIGRAKRAAAGKNIHSVKEIWSNEKAESGILYPVGGAFVSYLYEQSTIEQFKAIIKNQTIENAEDIYGKEGFDKIITDFNQLVGMQ